MSTGTLTEFARWFGVNKSTVTRARQAGRLVLTADGKVDFEQSAARWHATGGARTDMAARHAAQRGAALPHPSADPENAATARAARPAGQSGVSSSAGTGRGAALPELDEAGAGLSGAAPADGSERARYKAIVLHYENQTIKLEMALRRGLRYPKAAVGREANGLGAMVRAGIERVVDQIAPRLAATASDAERCRIIAAELMRLDRDCKREFPRALRRLNESAAGKPGGDN